MKKHVLLVEYDETSVNIIKEVLSSPLFEVTQVTDGEQAQKALQTKKFDLLITAAMLPRFHGFNLSLSAAADHPDLKIIVISGIYKGLEYKYQATTQYRAHDFFEKPLDKTKFKDRVIELLNISAADIQQSAASQVKTAVNETVSAPVPKNVNEMSTKKMSSDDIFGDILKKIEKKPAANTAFTPPAPPSPTADAARKDDIMRTQKFAAAKDAPAQTQTFAAKNDNGSQTIMMRKAEETSPSPRASAPVEPTRPVSKPFGSAKVEDDIAKIFEETLSGLGVGPKKPASSQPKAPAPAPKHATESASPAAASVKPQQEPPVTMKFPMPDAKKEDNAEPVLLEPGLEVKTQPVADVKMGKKPEDSNEVGDYVLLGMIARGGMAEVYKAKKKGVKGFEKIIAIKKILTGYGEDDKYIEMLVDEAKIAAELSHPNIVQIYDLGKKDNYYFIAMEYVQGRDLRNIMRKILEKDTLIPLDVSLYVIAKTLEALGYSHKAKDSHGRFLEIVHRDVSPPNILMSYSGDVKLTDFGVSKASIKMHQTVSGALKGKLLYMSPEQARGEENIDSRSDLYSVGIILFELVTGKKLFIDTSEMGVLNKVQRGEVVSPRVYNTTIDPELERIIMRALQKDRQLRYQDAGQMLVDIDAFMKKHFDSNQGAVQLTHFLYNLFKEEIIKEGIKVELKPLPEPAVAPSRPDTPPPMVEKPSMFKPAVPDTPASLPPDHFEIKLDMSDEFDHFEPPTPPTPAAKPALPEQPAHKPESSDVPQFTYTPTPVSSQFTYTPPPPSASPKPHSAPPPQPAQIHAKTPAAPPVKTPEHKPLLDVHTHPLLHGMEAKKSNKTAIYIGIAAAIILFAAGFYFFLLPMLAGEQTGPVDILAPVKHSTSNQARKATPSTPDNTPTTTGQNTAAPDNKLSTARATATTPAQTNAQNKAQTTLPVTTPANKNQPTNTANSKPNATDTAANARTKPAQNEAKNQPAVNEPPKSEEKKDASKTDAANTTDVKKDDVKPLETDTVRREITPAVPALKEGDLVPENEVDVRPVALHEEMPYIPGNIITQADDNKQVMIRFLVDVNGNVSVTQWVMKTANDKINSIIMDAIKKWKYEPAKKNGLRVQVWKNKRMVIKK